MLRFVSRAPGGLAIVFGICNPHIMMRTRLQKGFTLIELMIAVAIIGILSAIAIPTFTKVQARSKQSEVKANLKAIFTAQRAFFQEKNHFSPMAGEVGFEAERNNRYAYFLSAGSTLEDRSTSTITQATTYTGIQVDTFKYGSTYAQTYAATACGTEPEVVDAPARFVATAQGNIDGDPTIDEWSISSESRVFTPGANCTADLNNPSGEPANDQSDVSL
jgi:type IV pilus assembly protein PilA